MVIHKETNIQSAAEDLSNTIQILNELIKFWDSLFDLFHFTLDKLHKWVPMKKTFHNQD